MRKGTFSFYLAGFRNWTAETEKRFDKYVAEIFQSDGWEIIEPEPGAFDAKHAVKNGVDVFLSPIDMEGKMTLPQFMHVVNLFKSFGAPIFALKGSFDYKYSQKFLLTPDDGSVWHKTAYELPRFYTQEIVVRVNGKEYHSILSAEDGDCFEPIFEIGWYFPKIWRIPEWRFLRPGEAREIDTDYLG